MAIDQKVLRRLHDMKITEVTDSTSRFSFKFECACGVQGFFFDRGEAEQYQDFHCKRQGIKDAEPIEDGNSR